MAETKTRARPAAVTLTADAEERKHRAVALGESGHGLDHPLLDGGDELAGDGATDDLVDELEALAPAAGLEVRIQELHRDDLGRCRGAWLLSSGRILARVTHVDGQELPSSPLDVRLSRLLGVPWR